MRGATPNWTSKASSNPPTIKTIAACAHGYWVTSPFGLDISSNSTQHTTVTQVCAANSRAAMPPAIAGEGKCANSSGTTKNPIVVRLPHHRAAKSAGRRLSMAPGVTGS
jgi:hypothetical protein